MRKTKISWFVTIGGLIYVLYKKSYHLVSEVRCSILTKSFTNKEDELVIEAYSNNVTFHTVKKGTYKIEVCTIC